MPTSSRKLLVRILPVLAVLGIVIYLVVRSHASEKPGAAAAPPRVVPVTTATVEKREVPVWLEGLGTVSAFQQVTARPQVDGRLDKVFFKEGQQVKKGDLLAQIDPRPFLVQLHQAEGALARDRATLSSGKRNLDRYQALVNEKLIAQQQLDDQVGLVGQSEGAVQVDQAAVESARLNLDYARIQAPIDGIVGVRLVDPGNLVRATDPTGVVTITQLDPAAVFFTLPQDDLPRLSAALARGEVRVEAYSRDGLQRLGQGKLAVVDNQINQATSTLRLKAILPNPTRSLWPNQFVKMRLLLDTEHGALVVPAAAIQRGPQGVFVYVAGTDDKAALRPVEVGLITGEIAIVKKGVEVGELVVVEGQSQLRPGTPVAPRKAGKPDGKPNAKADGKGAGKPGTPDEKSADQAKPASGK
jgi:multidrug efflux system membrane fusion protein